MAEIIFSTDENLREKAFRIIRENGLTPSEFFNSLLQKIVSSKSIPVEKEKAIYIRRTYRNKLPDAIIVATAIVKDLTLLTADKDFNKISELKMVLL